MRCVCSVGKGKEANASHFLLIMSGKNIKKKELLGNTRFIYLFMSLYYPVYPYK